MSYHPSPIRVQPCGWFFLRWWLGSGGAVSGCRAREKEGGSKPAQVGVLVLDCETLSEPLQALASHLSDFSSWGMWDLPWIGIKLVSPALASGFLTTGPPGKTLRNHLYCLLPPWVCSHCTGHFFFFFFWHGANFSRKADILGYLVTAMYFKVIFLSFTVTN